jgi:hypothetical protein
LLVRMQEIELKAEEAVIGKSSPAKSTRATRGTPRTAKKPKGKSTPRKPARRRTR